MLMITLYAKQEASFETESLFNRKCIYLFVRFAITLCPMSDDFNKCTLKLLGIRYVIKGSAALCSLRPLLGYDWSSPGFIFT